MKSSIKRGPFFRSQVGKVQCRKRPTSICSRQCGERRLEIFCSWKERKGKEESTRVEGVSRVGGRKKKSWREEWMDGECEDVQKSEKGRERVRERGFAFSGS